MSWQQGKRRQMIPIFPEFKNLELSDKVEIENITKKFPPYSDFLFTEMWSWDIHEPVLLSIINSNLLVKQTDCLSGKPFYTIIGTISISETIDEIFAYLEVNGLPPALKCVPEETVLYTNGLSSVIEDKDNRDYIYDVYKLHTSQGSGYRSHRNGANIFTKGNINIDTKPIDLTDDKIKLKLIELFKIWSKNKEDNINEYEFQALNRLLNSSDYFNYVLSLGVFCNDELIAFSISDIFSNDFAYMHFMKGDTNYKGCFQYIMKETISYFYSKGIKYVNLGPDLGIASLKYFKLSYRPVNYLKKYTIESNN